MVNKLYTVNISISKSEFDNLDDYYTISWPTDEDPNVRVRVNIYKGEGEEDA